MIFVYSLSTFGIGVKQFYCCGKLKSTGIALVQQDYKEKKGKGRMGCCCNTKFKSLKVKDFHIAADAKNTSGKYFPALHLFTRSFDIAALANESKFLANAIHAPPLHYAVVFFLVNCTYLI